jgi:hypothetical protein
MCGIAGAVLRDVGVARTAVWRMNARMEARGPDDEGVVEFPTVGVVALGSRRLAVIDPSSAGISRDGRCNGGPFQRMRKNSVVGRRLGHAWWYPDYQMRLFSRDRGRFEHRLVYERVAAESRTVSSTLRWTRDPTT